MQVTDIGSREEGKIWHRKLVTSKFGALVTLIRSASARQTKTVRMLHVAFDTTGESFIAGDHHGHIYVFDISRNRFKLVQKTGQACTALAFNLRRTTEFLVALADYSIKCFDKDTRQLVSWMRGHEGAVSSLSVHSSGCYAISTSSDTAQLWDIDTFQRKRKLNIRQSVGIQKVFFLPHSNTILSCFSDDSIFAWESDTLFCKYQLPVPQDGPRIHYRTFAVTQDGKTLAAAGRSNLVHLWCLESQQLLRVIQMSPKVRTVRYLDFLPDSFDGGSNQTLGVLSQEGIMRFINIQTCKQIFEIGSHEDAISSASISPKGHHIVAVMDSGALKIYDVRSLTPDISQPPQPLLKKVTKGNSNEGFCLKVKVQTGTGQHPVKTSGRRIQTKVLPRPTASTLDNKEIDLPNGLNRKRLQALLRAFGEFPAKYRMFIWRSLLHLPENHAAFSSLTNKGLYSAYMSLQERFPIKSHKLQRGLQRVLSALAHWAAVFGETDYLPLLAFPFVKLFQNNPLICFEVVATVIVNWCQHWFEYFPNPPLNVLNLAENVLAHHDRELLQHFVACGVTSQLYAWPLFETLFSEVLIREEWLKLFDNVFSNHPSFLLMAVVAYVTCCRAPLLLCTDKKDFEYFFHHRNSLDIGAMLKEAYRLMENTPADIHPSSTLSEFEPLTQGQYPIFNKYPTFIVEYQSQERERIRHQEVEYLRERQEVQELHAEAVRQQAEFEAWYKQQELLVQGEEQHRRILQEEENKLAEQRARLAAMKRELKVKELNLIDSARRRFLKHQQDQRRIQLQRLDDEIQRKMVLRDQETATAVHDIEVRQMELDAQRHLFEQQLAKEQEQVSQEVNAEVETRRRRAEIEDSTLHNLIETDADLSQKNKRVMEESLAEVGQMEVDADWQAEVIKRLQKTEERQEKQRDQLVNLCKQTRAKEEEIVQLMVEVEGKQWDDVLAKQAELDEERQAAVNAQWRSLISQETETKQHQGKLQKSLEDSLNHQKEKRLRSSCSSRGLLHKPQIKTTNISLNNQSPSDNSSYFSLDRGRGELDCKERELMDEIRELRTKLAARARVTDFNSTSAISSIHSH
ncbi:TBC1 domain family member 31-like isoform X1 [Xyrauchen texanus]|uniref:TBC1 domain family member 31-like isoform X1 n=2 Tax=Xyrauchen texanus TaxID=154827 RepID=UPI0022418A7C|nr:TBC1 domain family member 31-like isoform X1 [Xyrauchen texanus]XP_051999244.1 TBC1 domain family member 31-like isoform X1 [Xyrauchen texanus]